MDRSTFLITVFCLIDDWLTGQRVRARGPLPTLYYSEVLTIEVVGAFLGLATDEGIHAHFCAYYADYFPRLCTVDRTTFTRQAANLWAVKQRLWRHLLTRVAYDPAFSIVDSCPIPVCQFARARRCRRLREYAAYGKDELVRQTYYGLRLHLRVCWPGVIVGFNLVAANEPDLPVAESDLLPGVRGWALADRGYWRAGTISDLTARPLPARTVQRQEAGARAVAALAGRQAAADRDGARPTGRALSAQAGLGARCLAPLVALATDGSQPYARRPPLPATRAVAVTVRRPAHRLILAHRVT